MDQSSIPSLSEGVVGSRFITQDEVDTAKQRREEQWKAAYARSVLFLLSRSAGPPIKLSRLGQEPPPQQQEEVYDGRSLAEVSIPIHCPQTMSYSLPAVGFDIMHRNSLLTGSVLFICTMLLHSTILPGSKARGMGRENQARSVPIFFIYARRSLPCMF